MSRTYALTFTAYDLRYLPSHREGTVCEVKATGSMLDVVEAWEAFPGVDPHHPASACEAIGKAARDGAVVAALAIGRAGVLRIEDITPTDFRPTD